MGTKCFDTCVHVIEMKETFEGVSNIVNSVKYKEHQWQ
jgi:hypothetical protein